MGMVLERGMAIGMREAQVRFGETSRLAAPGYFYDGQMQVENYEAHSNNTALLTRYGIGARGIDYMETYNGSTTTVGFPIFDGHGNMIATIGRSGSTPYYSVGDQREYDVWGKIRSGNTTGDPKPRYCANLGHVQDDESGLIYMRARYYEPTTGRFVSEDPAQDGRNYFQYATNNPVNKFDASGENDLWDAFKAAIQPLLVTIGGMNLAKLAAQLVANQAGYALFALAQMMFGVGSALSRMGQGLAASSNPFARIGGAILAHGGAKAIAAGVMLLQYAEWFMFLGGEAAAFDPIDRISLDWGSKNIGGD
ncbi:MAG: RHS repeat-associated core domain-containing protein [Armatimonadetes bacterium]|nr:RHS repeat-associated core domain-containing protein [Armatimonadota bacterium]